MTRILPAKLAGFIIPGNNSNAPDYGGSISLAAPAQMRSIGANLATVHSYYYQLIPTSTALAPTTPLGEGSVAGCTTVADANLQTVAQAVLAAGLNAGLKPQILSDTPQNQNTIFPGGAIITDAAYSSGGTVLTSSQISGVSATGPGGGNPRILSFNSTDIPNSVASTTYGIGGDLTNSTCTISSPTTLTLQDGAIFQANRTSGNAPVILLCDESSLTSWFASVQTLYDRLLALADFYYINIDTEHDYLQQAAPSYYRALISHIRSEYPNIKITAGQETYNYSFNRITWWDACDWIGLDFYNTIQSEAGGESAATIESYWTAMPASVNGSLRNYLATLSAMSAAWNKQIFFPEMGYQSIVGSGYWGGSTPGSPTVYQTDQANCVTALMQMVLPQTWFAGFNWWVWNNLYGASEAETYTPWGKTAATSFSNFLLPSSMATSASGTVLTDGSGNRLSIPA